MTIRDLALNDDIVVDGNYLDITVDSICTNTEDALKKAGSGMLFVCIKGSKYDTHNDIGLLVNAGICNIIVQENTVIWEMPENINIMYSRNTRKTLAVAAKLYYECPDKKLKIIGITGTKGKTTVSYMIECALQREGKNCAIIGTNGIIYNGNTYECDNSTPSPLEYYAHLKKMTDSGVEYVIAEITSQSLKQYRTYGTTFDIAVFTNLYPDHIGKYEHRDMNEYKACKGMLFQWCRMAVINDDDENSNYFKDICRVSGKKYISFSAKNKKADYFCRKIKTKCTFSAFVLKKQKTVIPLPGRFNVYNALCAMTVLCELGVPVEKTAKAIANVTVPGRCERVDNPAGVNIIIDYAHNKESLENILAALRSNCRGKLYCVFGAGGDRSALRRTGMGEAACRYADYSIITSDNPRSEPLQKISCDIVKGFGESRSNYILISDRKSAIHHALDIAKKGDTILLAGKGTQNYQEINGVKYPFDERDIVSQYYKSFFNQR